MFAVALFLKVIPSSASESFSSTKFLLVIVGDGGLDAAGEKTPTPDSFKLFSSDVKYARGWEGVNMLSRGRVSLLPKVDWERSRSVSWSDSVAISEEGVVVS